MVSLLVNGVTGFLSKAVRLLRDVGPGSRHADSPVRAWPNFRRAAKPAPPMALPSVDHRRKWPKSSSVVPVPLHTPPRTSAEPRIEWGRGPHAITADRIKMIIIWLMVSRLAATIQE